MCICIGAWNPMMSHPYYAMGMPQAMPFLGPKQGLSRATSETTGYASATSLGPGTEGSFPRESLSAAQVPIGGAKKRKNSISYGPLPIPAASYGPPVKKALVPSDLPPPPMTVHITPPLAFNPALSSINQPASYNLPNYHPKPITSPTTKLSKQQSPIRLATSTITSKTTKTKRTHSHPHTTIHTPQDSQAGAAAGLSDEDAASSLLGFYQQLKSSSSDSGSDTGPDGGGSDAGGSE